VILDLQKALDQCYDAGRYAEQFDYQRDPPVPLPTHYKTWANELLRAKGLRRTRKTGGRS
jgi:hypothetical protein